MNKKPEPPALSENSMEDILRKLVTKIESLEIRLKEVEGLSQEREVFHAAYTGYMNMYLMKFPNLLKQDAMRETALAGSLHMARTAVKVFRENIPFDRDEPRE